MAALDRFTRSIYHEKQQPGSMLCAQHALNSLLQGNYFTAPDLSDIARTLDALEESYDNSNTGDASTNMDDTGFFSVQVLERALGVWGLNLTRWRGEDMRPYHDHPHTQLAFILNLEQHWFTLRRFGQADANIDNDHGDGHWFNLNSFLLQPEWVGKLYLGMVLQQAETDGYSVFAVTQADPLAPLALPRTELDEIASTLPEPTSASRPNLERMLSSHTKTPASTSAPHHVEGLEDEDYELQAALQASMMGSGSADRAFELPPVAPPPLSRGFASLPPLSDPQSPSSSGAQTPTEDPVPLPTSIPATAQTTELDPVTASLERNKLMLERMRAQQEFAQRELWAEGSAGPDAAAMEARRQERRREEEEEAEQLRLAIEESEALARQQGHHRTYGHDDEDEDVDMDSDEEFMPQTSTNPSSDPHPRSVGDRVYDDDDAELQAALKASLENVPHGWELPELPLQRTPVPPPLQSAPSTESSRSLQRDREDAESVLSDETSTTATENTPSEAIESVSVDELRRRRLARFGA